MGKVSITQELTPERRELDALEVIFDDCKEAYFAGGDAIKTIRDKRLWKAAGWKSWEEYCPARWDKSDVEMNRRIKDFELLNKWITPNGVDLKTSHVRSVGGFPPDMQQEILDVAAETAPGGKLTAAWIEQTGRRLMDARRAEMNAAAEEAAAAARTAATEDNEEEEEPEEDAVEEPIEEEEAVEEPAPVQSAAARATQDAANHPIAMAEQNKIWWGQVKRWFHKGERLALSLNCTVQDLIDKGEAGEL